MVRYMEVMTPQHPRWKEFIQQLQDACEVRDAEGQVGWVCDGTTKNARRVLETMGTIEVEKSLAYFRDFGGFCDCEIVFNVDSEDY
jgi:SH3-like domain-containing protein